MLPNEEYVEQVYFFRTVRERMLEGMSTQELLAAVRQEVLATTKLPYAIAFMLDELRHTGGFATAMAHVPHYFTPLQSYIVAEAERPEGKFDFRVALEILQHEADYRSRGATPQGLFLYQFEVLSRNRLGYDPGLSAMAADPIYDERWREWILTVRRQIGLFDLSEMIYVRSELYRERRGREEAPVLFGEREGRIAWANLRKDPLYLFAALQRHLGYPAVPRPKPEDTQRQVLPALQRKVERLESRLRLLEEEIRGGINIARFYKREQQKNARGDIPDIGKSAPG